jgi:hypothetical protein
MMALEDSIETVADMEEALTDTSITEIGMDVESDDRISMQMAELEAELATGSLPATGEDTITTSTPISSVTESTSKSKREADKKKLDEMRRQIEDGLRS